MSDRDKDGMLTREEFMIAMYLSKLAADGNPLPVQVPPQLLLKNSSPTQLPTPDLFSSQKFPE
jgi:hypothetical protein